MDILTVPNTEGHLYILTIQDFLIKYSVTVPFKQVTSTGRAVKSLSTRIPRRKHGLQIRTRIL